MSEHEQTVRVSLDAEAIQRQVVDAILESAIGDAVKKGIENLRDKFKDAYEFNHWIEQAIKEETHLIIKDLIHTEMHDMIVAKVKEVTTEKLVADVVTRVWNRATRDW